MNLRQLEAFRATIESGSITGAAELLHISQPSVSRLISDLERSVGFPLFLRVGRGLKATEEARSPANVRISAPVNAFHNLTFSLLPDST